MITTASSEHLDGIRAVWLQAFGEDAGYIDMFLGKRARLSDTLVYLHDDKVCGILFMLPCKLDFAKESYKCAYFYSVATDKEHRGQGISTHLLLYAYELCGRRGYDVCALVPADKPLFDFYAKRGYGIQGYVKNLTVTSEQLQDINSTSVFMDTSPEELVRMRRASFGDGYLAWDEQALDYAIIENKYLGGQFYGYSLNGEVGGLCCLPSGDSLVINEFMGNTALIDEVVAGLHKIYNKQNYLFRLSNTARLGELTPFAMTKWISKGTDKAFYLSLCL